MGRLCTDSPLEHLRQIRTHHAAPVVHIVVWLTVSFVQVALEYLLSALERRQRLGPKKRCGSKRII